MVKIVKVEGTELYHRYPGQTAAQPCYVALDARNGGNLTAHYDSEVGNARPFSVHHGHVTRWSIPALKAAAANALLEKIKPHAERVCSGYEPEWDGQNIVAGYTSDAQAATEAIEELCESVAPDDAVMVWDAEEWLGGIGSRDAQRAAFGIGEDTPGIRLMEIETEIILEARSVNVDVVEGLDKYLMRLRDRV